MIAADFLLNDALLVYTVSIIGVLMLLILIGMVRDRTHNFKLNRLAVHRCEDCGLVFAVGRFEKSRPRPCPRCGSKKHSPKLPSAQYQLGDIYKYTSEKKRRNNA